mgnify:CR=1 FL=1
MRSWNISEPFKEVMRYKNTDLTDLCFIVSTSSWGGVERWIVNLANAFVTRGLSVDVVLLREGVVPYPDELDANVHIFDCNCRPGPLADVRIMLSLSRYFRQRRPISVLVAKFRDAVLTDRANRFLGHGGRLYWTFHSTPKRNRKNRRRIAFMKRRFRRPGSIIAVSQGVANELADQFGIKREVVTAIYNPILGEDVGLRCDAEVLHQWLVPRESRPAPVLVGAGRLVPAKDFATLIRAVAILQSRHRCRLLILGEGPARIELEALVQSLELKDSVDLAGWVDDPVPYMARADLFVLSSCNEGLGNVLVEAMATGIPVVSTDCPNGPREILRDGELGPLVSPEDPDALASAIAATLESPIPPEQLREGAKRFFTNTVVDAYLSNLQMKPNNAINTRI